ncbi:ankyrin repeat and MYND domain-containing protein 2 [Trichogramma pretiosum]|uniref:ankyrin repeat and MYND domain-containing protein 2 n=1 Tax=Trichogramma pretiosum TaxID=7493 RepID=UPI0006C94E8E|nr:ankyrin repeat and MYND domain-containing protein 2 [Trichogramma pretiosum]
MSEESDVKMQNLRKEVFDKITNNQTDDLRALINVNDLKINFVDEFGMSPLQHACYKGNKEIVQMLLDQGAVVNDCEHKHGYSALHFAALSGNSDLCNLLMSHGAKINAKNSVGRTAAQMAGFVGNHSCASAINNFVPKANLDYYIKPQNLQKEPMLHPHLADSFYLFITQVNVHPVKVIMNLKKLPGLIDNLPMVQKVLECMSKKEMNKGADANEIMSFKYHYLCYLTDELSKSIQRHVSSNTEKDGSNEDKKHEAADLLIKKFLKYKNDGTQEYLELFLRDLVREYSYRDTAIFRQMVATLTSSDPPSAVSVISAAINGQQVFKDVERLICETCGEEKAPKKCSKCKVVQYCDRECQRLHWFIHKKNCSRLNQSSQQNHVPESAPNSEEITNAVTSRLQNLIVN